MEDWTSGKIIKIRVTNLVNKSIKKDQRIPFILFVDFNTIHSLFYIQLYRLRLAEDLKFQKIFDWRISQIYP